MTGLYPRKPVGPPPPKKIRTTAHFGVQTLLTERLFLLLTYTNRQTHTILLSQWHWLAKTGNITSSLRPPPNITAAATTTITQSQCDAPPPPPPSLNLNVTHWSSDEEEAMIASTWRLSPVMTINYLSHPLFKKKENLEHEEKKETIPTEHFSLNLKHMSHFPLAREKLLSSGWASSFSINSLDTHLDGFNLLKKLFRLLETSNLNHDQRSPQFFSHVRLMYLL